MKKNITKILLMISVITVCIGAKVYADYIMNASEVEYTKSDSTKVSVKAALDDLYNKSQQVANVDVTTLKFSKSSVGLAYSGSQSITITNPNSYEITVETSDSTVATVTKNSNTKITINALSKTGDANITVRAAGIKVKKINVGVWQNGMPISTAKSVINASNIADYQGTQVDYSPSGGGTWRIFYYDADGKYGDGAGTLYIKRDYNSSTTMADSSYGTYYTNSSNKSDVLADMKKFNPKWSAGDGTIDANNENVASYLCYHGAWTNYVVSGVGKYAIGSPSTEMYIDAWNQYKGSKLLDYKWVANRTLYFDNSSTGTTSANGYACAPAYGYTTISQFGWRSYAHSLTTEANSMFMTSGSYWWLASPSCYNSHGVCAVDRWLWPRVLERQPRRHRWGLPASFSWILDPMQTEVLKLKIS